MKKIFLLLAACLLALGASAKMTGTIGTYPIVVVTNSNGDLSYYYYKSNPNSHFKLVKDASNDDMEHYHEVAPNGKITGRFVLELSYGRDGGCVATIYTGTFTNTTNGKKFDVEFDEVTCY